MMILQEGAKYALLHLIEKDINQLKINGKSEISMRNMPTNSLSKAYNYRLWIVNLNTRYNISSPFRHSLCLGHYFWKKSIYPFVWKLRFLRKNVFFLACYTNFTSIFTLTSRYFNPRLQTMFWNISNFNVSKRVKLYHICFSKMGK